jgi:hypothetical protein
MTRDFVLWEMRPSNSMRYRSYDRAAAEKAYIESDHQPGELNLACKKAVGKESA